MWRAYEHKVRRARPCLHGQALGSHRTQSGQLALALGCDLCHHGRVRIAGTHAGKRGGLAQHINRIDLANRREHVDDLRRRDHVAQTRAGGAERLGQRMQNHQVGMLGNKPLRRGGRAKRIVGKLNVGLVDHDHAGTRIAQRCDKVERCYVARRIVGRGHDGQVALGRGRKHSSLVELKGRRVAPHVAHLGLTERRKERILAKARRAVEQGPPRTAKRQQIVIEQLVAAVSHADVLARHTMPGSKLVAQVVGHGIGIAVERCSSQGGVDRLAHAGRHGIGVLVGRKVDARGRKVGIVGLNAGQVGLDELLHARRQLGHIRPPRRSRQRHRPQPPSGPRPRQPSPRRRPARQP